MARELSFLHPTPVEEFNKLSPCPVGSVDLGDNRELRITEWRPVGITDGSQYGVPVSIKGYIVEKQPDA